MRSVTCFFVILIAANPTPRVFAGPPVSDLDQRFSQSVRPVLNTFCVSCHSGTTPAAQFDLKQYSTVADTVRDHARWALVAEKLTAREMPPKTMKQPTDAERHVVIEWVETMRTTEAQKNAGDPGIVLVRRLSNAEYNYSIRDLTGVDIKPTREFPVDPANTAGFDNSGESLKMSPALLWRSLRSCHFRYSPSMTSSSTVAQRGERSRFFADPLFPVTGARHYEV